MSNGYGSPFGNGGGKRPPTPEELLAQLVAKLRGRFGGALGLAGLGLLLALWLATGVYQVNPSEAGVVLRFGKVTAATGPGLHWHFPWPVETVLKPPVTVVLKEEVGFRTIDVGPPARYRQVTEESRMLTSDGNIVDLDFIVQYRIKDPKAFLFNVRDPSETLRDSAESAMREVVGRNTINKALTEGRLEVQTEAQVILQAMLDRYQVGLHVVTVKLQDVVPPDPVQDAFKDVINAEQDKERMINEAEGFANDVLPRARGDAAQLLNQARGYSESVVKEAEGQAERFDLLYDAYRRAPVVTRKRLYLETLEEVFADVNMIIIDEKIARGALPLLPLAGVTGSGGAGSRSAEVSR
jgi:membrane protease subunit HflK